MDEGAWGISLFAFSASAFFLASISPDIWFFFLQHCQWDAGKRVERSSPLGKGAGTRQSRSSGGAHTVGHLAGLRVLATVATSDMKDTPITRFTCANLRVFFATPMAAERVVGMRRGRSCVCYR